MTNNHEDVFDLDRFVDDVLPAEGPFVYLLDGKDNKTWQRVVTDKPTFIRTLLHQASLGKNTWFALASFLGIKKKGQRAVSNVRELKSVWHDVDVGKEGAYVTRDAAIRAVYAMVSEGKLLLPSYIVDSGYGVHLYWAFESSATLERWGTHAAQTAKALLQGDKNLCVDMSRVRDAASILRLPGTRNTKDKDNHKAVGIVSDHRVLYTQQDFDKFYGLEDIGKYLPKARRINAEFDLGAPIIYSQPPMGTLKKIALPWKADGTSLIKNCAQFRHFATHQNEQSYQMWFTMVGMAKGTVQGAELAHIISQNHAGYTHEETQSKYDDWMGGWPACTTVRAYSPKPSLCNGCPYAEVQDKSPLHLARELVKSVPIQLDTVVAHVETLDESGEVVQEEVQVASPPRPFSLTANNTVVLVETEDDLGNVRVTPRAFLLGRLIVTDLSRVEGQDDVSVHYSYEYAGKKGTRTTVGQIPMGVLNKSAADVSGLLGTSGVVVKLKEQKLVLEYLQCYTEKLLEEMDGLQSISYHNLGWKDDDKMFVLPAAAYNKTAVDTEIKITANLDNVVSTVVTPKGVLSEWQTNMRRILHNDELAQLTFGILIGFASPLMKFATHKNATVVFWGPPGSGKSTALTLCNSVFGTPSQTVIKSSDSKKSRLARLGLYGNVAMTFDEATKMPAEDLDELLYNVSEGRAPVVLNRERTVYDDKMRWSLLMAATSNYAFSSVASMNYGGGQLVRLWEFNVERGAFKPREKELMAVVMDSLTDNHGVAGPAFVQHIVGRTKEIQARIREVEKEVSARKLARYNERFVDSTIAAIVVAAEELNASGILEINMSWLWDALEKRKPNEQEADAYSSEFLAKQAVESVLDDMRQETVVFTAANAHHQPKNLQGLGSAQKDVSVRVEVTVNPADCVVYVSAKKMVDVCRKNGIVFAEHAAALTKAGLLVGHKKPIRKRIGAGIPTTGGARVKVYVFHYGQMNEERFAHFSEQVMRQDTDNKVVPIKGRT